MSSALLADVGGSKSRFALASSAGRPERMVVIDNDTVPDLETAIMRYLEETGAHPRAATFAIAGPIHGEDVALTNRAWRFRCGDLARRFGFSPLRVLNDFEAVAWALPCLGAADARLLGGPRTTREGVKLVLGPGTGLGVAALLPAGGRWHVVASEGGHAAFGPQAADEVDAFARVRDQCGGTVSAEMVLSGPGLVRLARALDPARSRPSSACGGGQRRSSAAVFDAKDADAEHRLSWEVPETIVAGALAGEPSAQAAARLFVRLLGRFAGSMALTFKAVGGVYITGGVAGGLDRLLEDPQFRAAFESHPPHQALLATIPTWLITCEQPGLIGCAAVASDLGLTA